MTPFLFDNNLSESLCDRIADAVPGCSHVSGVGLAVAGDLEIWQFAKAHGLTIVSKDNDFQNLAGKFGAPPRVVILVVGNGPTSHVEFVLRTHLVRIREFCESDDALLIIQEPFAFTKHPT